MVATNNKLLTPKELAGILAVSVRTVRRLTTAGVLPYYRLSHKALRFKVDDVETALSKLRIPSRSELR